MKQKIIDKLDSILRSKNISRLSEFNKTRDYIDLRCGNDNNMWSARVDSFLYSNCCCNKCHYDPEKAPNVVVADKGSYVIIDISTARYKNILCKLDKVDYNNIYSRVSIGKRGYPTLHLNGRARPIHRTLNPSWIITDHINGDPLDNRRVNLRECSVVENGRNKGVSRVSNSGRIGVSYNNDKTKWRASIAFGGKNIYCGEFEDLAEAIKAREDAEDKYYGAFARR